MSDQPDKLFREKLENHQRPAPPDAWGRIERGLAKKNNKLLWLRIAASLLLFGVAAIAIVSILKDDHASTITQKDTEVKQTVPNVQNSPVPKASVESAEVAPHESTKKQPEIAHSREVKKDSSPIAIKEKESKEQIMESELVVIQEEQVNVTPLVSSPEEITSTDNKKGFKLIIEADEVNQKYLKKESLANATSQEDNSSGIKKLLDKAQDLKNNQNPLGDLRQMKNEIFALNFQENKKLEQNK